MPSACFAWVPLSIAALSMLAGCATNTRQQTALTAPYVRIAQPDTKTTEVQIALREFVPLHGQGPTIWLTGTMHIAESNYYASLQRHLGTQSVVLYEEVADDSDSVSRRRWPPRGPSPNSSDKQPARRVPSSNDNPHELSSAQASFAKALGVAFQFEAIDYTPTNFFLSDLSERELHSVETYGTPNPLGDLFRVLRDAVKSNRTSSASSGVAIHATALDRVSEGPPSKPQVTSTPLGPVTEAPAKNDIMPQNPDPELPIPDNPLTETEFLLSMLDGRSDLGALAVHTFRFIATRPTLQAMLKLSYIQQIESFRGEPWDRIFIQERNKKVITDLKDVQKVVPNGSIAILYGAGHMVDLERRLRSELAYRPVGEAWLPALSISAREIRLARSIFPSPRK